MEVKGHDLTMIRGDSESLTLELSTFDTNLQEVVKIPLVTGDVVYFTIKFNTTTAEKVLQKKVEVFEDGNAVIEILPEDTEGLIYRTYKYDVQVIQAGGIVTTVLGPAMFIIKEEVTFEKV